MAPAVARRPHTNGNARNGRGGRESSAEEEDDDRGYALNDFDAALLQIFIAKRVIRLDDAVAILTQMARATGPTVFRRVLTGE
jgi:hypothetical protein